MSYTFLQFFPFLSILPPLGGLGWLAWLVMLAAAVALAWRLERRQVLWTRTQQLRLLALVLAVPLAILLLTVRLAPGAALPIPELGVPARGALLAPLLALPWMLALVWFGARAALPLAALGGLLLATADTRSPFTALEFALLAGAFAFLRSQRYSTTLFAWLRKPWVAAALLSLLYPFIYLASAFFWVSPSWLVSLDFALSRLGGVTLAAGLPLWLGALLLQLALARWPQWERPSAHSAQPAPSERSLEARFLFALVPLALIAFVAMGALTWWAAGRSAQQLFADRIDNNVQIAAGAVPFVLETGQSLMQQLAADGRLADAPPAQALDVLQSHLSSIPYFEQLTLLDSGGNVVAGTPLSEYSRLQPSPAELDAVALALQGVNLQLVSAAPSSAQPDSAQLVFVAAVRNSNQQVRNVLVGRTVLASNPFARPVAQSLESINALGAQAFLLDGQGQIVMAPFSAALLQPYQVNANAPAYEEVAVDGTRMWVRYQPAAGSNWAVLVRWPLRLSQQQALRVALPMLGVLLLLAAVAYATLRSRLRSVSQSLQTLAAETQRIAAGDLRAPLSITGSDEIGRLGSAFEVMRRAVLSRAEESQRLLALSHGLSSSLEVRSHIEPLLEAALAAGASLARLVFLNEGGGSGVSFGQGEGHERYEALDAQILALTRAQDQVLLSNPARARLKVEKGTPYPGSVAAFALKDGRKQLGALWLAYDQPQRFEDSTRHYLESLAAQASAAASNAGQYLQARLGQQRLEAVLAADGQPLLLLDAGQRLVFANPAASRVLRLRAGLAAGTAMEQAITHPELQRFLRLAGARPQSAQLRIEQAAYHAELNPLWDGAELLGFVCRLEDVTRSQQQKAAEREVLSTVGHDLQDPLQMVAGYLTMLRMLGPLNEQQEGYVHKIEASVEQITRLAASLLAVDRIQEAEGLRVEEFALAGLLQAAAGEVEAQARQKQIELVLDPAEGHERLLRADRTLLQRALVNLLDNAIRFSARGRTVRLAAKYSASKVTLSVKDSGVGIAPVDLPLIFTRREGQPASGLSIAHSIVERHKGRAWAESELGLGSTFYIELPLS